MRIGEIVTGVFLLIFAYLLLSNSRSTTSIIDTFASNSIQGIKVLQGRG